jgi:hypothetical protein
MWRPPAIVRLCNRIESVGRPEDGGPKIRRLLPSVSIFRPSGKGCMPKPFTDRLLHPKLLHVSFKGHLLATIQPPRPQGSKPPRPSLHHVPFSSIYFYPSPEILCPSMGLRNWLHETQHQNPLLLPTTGLLDTLPDLTRNGRKESLIIYLHCKFSPRLSSYSSLLSNSGPRQRHLRMIRRGL